MSITPTLSLLSSRAFLSSPPGIRNLPRRRTGAVSKRSPSPCVPSLTSHGNSLFYKQLSSSCCLFRATAVIFFVLFCLCNRYLFLFSTYAVFFLQPFLSDLASHFSEHLPFVFFCFLLFYFFLWPGLFCCVLVPGTLAFHLIYL